MLILIKAIYLLILLCAAASVYLIFYMIHKRNSIMKEFKDGILNKYEIEKE